MRQIIAALLIIIPTFSFCQSSATLDGKPEGTFVSVKLIEVTGQSFWKTKIVVSDGSKVLKQEKLKHVTPKNLASDLVKITAILNLVESHGYELVSTMSGSLQSTAQVTTYTFEKKE